MLKKTITFADLDGNPITEDFYFNLSKAELAEMELSKKGGLQKHLEKIVQSEETSEIVATFKHIISLAVGRRSEDGRRFIKSPEITNDFIQTDAYSVLFMELIENSAYASEFINGILPANLGGQRIIDELSTETVELPQPAKDEKPWMTEDREPTKEELRLMSKEDLFEVMQRKMRTTDDQPHH